MKLTCTWSPEQVSNFATFNCFFWPFPLLHRVPRIDSVQNRLMEARNRREAWRCQSRLTDLWFIIDLLGNVTIGNDHFGNRATGQISCQATGKRPGAPNGQSAPGHKPVPLSPVMLVKVCGVSVICSDGRLMNRLSVRFENWHSGSAAQSNDYQGNSIQSTTALCSVPLKPQRAERPHTSACHLLIWKTTVVIYNRCATCHSWMFIDEWVCDIFQKIAKQKSHHKSNIWKPKNT